MSWFPPILISKQAEVQSIRVAHDAALYTAQADDHFSNEAGKMAGMRHFGTGATRDQDTSKLDLEGFNSPLVEQAFGRYMNTHRVQPDGSVRASDNWQLGIPLDAYMKSLHRHLLDLWLHHRGFGEDAVDADIESVLCAIRFNVDGYLFEVLKQRRSQRAVASIISHTGRTEKDPAPREG